MTIPEKAPRDERPWFHFNDRASGSKEGLINFLEYIDWTGYRKIQDRRGRRIILLLNGVTAVAAIDFTHEQQRIFTLRTIVKMIETEKEQ